MVLNTITDAIGLTNVSGQRRAFRNTQSASLEAEQIALRAVGQQYEEIVSHLKQRGIAQEDLINVMSDLGRSTLDKQTEILAKAYEDMGFRRQQAQEFATTTFEQGLRRSTDAFINGFMRAGYSQRDAIDLATQSLTGGIRGAMEALAQGYEGRSAEEVRGFINRRYEAERGTGQLNTILERSLGQYRNEQLSAIDEQQREREEGLGLRGETFAGDTEGIRRGYEEGTTDAYGRAVSGIERGAGERVRGVTGETEEHLRGLSDAERFGTRGITRGTEREIGGLERETEQLLGGAEGATRELQRGYTGGEQERLAGLEDALGTFNELGEQATGATETYRGAGDVGIQYLVDELTAPLGESEAFQRRLSLARRQQKEKLAQEGLLGSGAELELDRQTFDTMLAEEQGRRDQLANQAIQSGSVGVNQLLSALQSTAQGAGGLRTSIGETRARGIESRSLAESRYLDLIGNLRGELEKNKGNLEASQERELSNLLQDLSIARGEIEGSKLQRVSDILGGAIERSGATSGEGLQRITDLTTQLGESSRNLNQELLQNQYEGRDQDWYNRRNVLSNSLMQQLQNQLNFQNQLNTERQNIASQIGQSRGQARMGVGETYGQGLRDIGMNESQGLRDTGQSWYNQHMGIGNLLGNYHQQSSNLWGNNIQQQANIQNQLQQYLTSNLLNQLTGRTNIEQQRQQQLYGSQYGAGGEQTQGLQALLSLLGGQSQLQTGGLRERANLGIQREQVPTGFQQSLQAIAPFLSYFSGGVGNWFGSSGGNTNTGATGGWSEPQLNPTPRYA